MLTGLDLGRSSAMNRWVTENGRPSAIFAVCTMFWLLVAFAVAVLAVASQLTLGAPTSIILCAGFAAAFALAVVRYVQSARALRRFHETGAGPA
jgi:hypothetical protein